MSRVLLAAALAVTLLAAPGAAAPPPPPSCAPQVVSDAYVRSVDAALRAGRDVWGERVLARLGGPTYAAVAGLLKPLLLVGSPAGVRGTALTDSGVHYVALGEPGGTSFADGDPTEPFALHVADGSQIASRRPDARRMTVYAGGERYGACLSRLAQPTLAEGHLPVLTVRYRDTRGVEWEQESFVARLPAGRLASFVRIAARAGAAGETSATLRITTTDGSAALAGRELHVEDGVALAFDRAATDDGAGGLRWRLELSGRREDSVHLVRPIDPAPSPLAVDAKRFAEARAATIAAWKARLASGAQVVVPERRVMNALRNLLVQNLQLAWRYSVGNAYETFYEPEGSAAALRLAEYGFLEDARQALESLLTRTRGRSSNWEQGEKLAAGAAYVLLSGDTAFLRRHTPTYARYARDFAVRRARDPNGLLDRQRYSGDIADAVYGLHHQSRAWRGLRDMAYAWGATGRSALARRYRAEARSFGRALRAAIARSAVEIAPGETFVPVSLLDPRSRAPAAVTATREGSYWNLVAPYGWASGIVPSRSSLAERILRYARRHGSFLLGLVRFNYYPTPVGSVRCDGLPGLRTPGVDNVYGVHRAQFLAELDRPDLLVLTLYAKLAHGMTRGTFVAGEGDTVGAVPPGVCPSRPRGEYHRSSYLPPSSANNDLFLVTLREQLVHWSLDDDGRPRSLHLAFSTPRAWLADGRRIAVSGTPTPFGELSYALESHLAEGYVDVSVRVPRRRPIRDLRLRLRLPGGVRPRSARVAGATLRPDGETFDLTGRTGSLRLRVQVR